MRIIVLDTNILVSALLVPLSCPDQIIKLVGNKMVQTRYSDGILAEYVSVLTRQKFHFQFDDVSKVVNGIIRAGIAVSPEPSILPMADEDDHIFYDAAKSTNSILITGNMKHYPSELFIMSPAEFMRIYVEGERRHE